MHKVRFFIITSSSLSRKFFSHSRYQRRVQSHSSGLSEKHYYSDQMKEGIALGDKKCMKIAFGNLEWERCFVCTKLVNLF
jgi:hypothetical protein